MNFKVGDKVTAWEWFKTSFSYNGQIGTITHIDDKDYLMDVTFDDLDEIGYDIGKFLFYSNEIELVETKMKTNKDHVRELLDDMSSYDITDILEEYLEDDVVIDKLLWNNSDYIHKNDFEDLKRQITYLEELVKDTINKEQLIELFYSLNKNDLSENVKLTLNRFFDKTINKTFDWRK